jgi:CRISPR-associated protein Csx17
MYELTLCGCTTRPLGSYLKSLAVLRLVSEQADPEARALWDIDTLQLRTTLSKDELAGFFLCRYNPTPILAPWNGASGFYEKDNKTGIDAIAASSDSRFKEYREAIALLRELPEVRRGKAKKEEEEKERRTAILQYCRNHLPDRAVEWLDAAVGIDSDGSRAYAPILGTGGNEGHLDYTNNFMERVARLLLATAMGDNSRELLANALFSNATDAFQAGKAGQYDPGRAGGVNQGQGIECESPTNPWNFVLALEGAVSWASGLYRRHGVSFHSFLCSPFTVAASRVGYGSASSDDDARAEIWAPIWSRPARYAEIRVLLREGRATVDGQPATNGLQFAEAATSLGIDRGIRSFVRYNLLRRRGDSYVALPVGEFPAQYRSQSDLIREFESLMRYLEREKLPPGCHSLRRSIDGAVYEVLLRGGHVRAVLASLGRLLRRLAVCGRSLNLPAGIRLKASSWLSASEYDSIAEVRIAAALASIWDRQVGPIRGNLFTGSAGFAWSGRDLTDRLIGVLQRRLHAALAAESESNPLAGACRLYPGDATLFIETSVDDALIEDLLFAFTCLDWGAFKARYVRAAEVLPVYAALKLLFLPGEIDVHGEPKRLRADSRIVNLLASGRGAGVKEAAEQALRRLRAAGLQPINVEYYGGAEQGRRMAAALLIPVTTGRALWAPVLEKEDVESLA